MVSEELPKHFIVNVTCKQFVKQNKNLVLGSSNINYKTI